MGTFLKWGANDCLKEENDVLVESNLTQKDVTSAINQRAKQWFLTKLNNTVTRTPTSKMKI